ncbi:MAG TPA: N-acetylmuramoyl-L-alanine amidase [Thermomicrobiales bacterium]|nr:N-acetylmuramoyl-L-alanine amidase [Thermomicrobiales bacterium]
MREAGGGRAGRLSRGLVRKAASLAPLAVLFGLGLLLISTSVVQQDDACPVPRGAAIVLDPGHGGEDPGALNAGLVEAELTLAIARRTADLLRGNGLSVALTRDDMESTLGNSERGRIANACDASVFVSIHLNSFDDPSVNYVKTFWAIEEKDLAFAQVMQSAQAAALQPGTNLSDGGMDVFESGALLTAGMPSALTESVFLSNPEEARRLADPAGARLEQIARAIASGIVMWLDIASIVRDL